MKKIMTAVVLLSAAGMKSQVAVGKSSVTNSSVSLEFANTENKGLILPYIENKGAISTNGTIIYDTTDHKVKYIRGGSWFDLSVDTTGTANIAIQTTKTERTTAKTAIGTNAATDTTPGVLVLTDTNKAMVLPKVVLPHLNIINPSAGMIVYDTVTKELAVYNGTAWSFWKP